jgi:RHS repeat-associated protein
VEHGPEGLEAVPYRFTGKELDEETGLYYYGARYFNLRTSRWISADPSIEEYLPLMPVDEEARKHNQNLPGEGGVFNYVNLVVYHYGGNNPVLFIDPTGEDQWRAHAVEVSWGGYFAGGYGGGFISGKALVGFENVETGEYFTAQYSFKMTDVRGTGFTVGASLVKGITYAEFESGTGSTKIARSYRGEVKILNVSGFYFTGSFITSESWTGWEWGVNPSYGGGVSWQTLEYELVEGSISPIYDSWMDQQQTWLDEFLYGE